MGTKTQAERIRQWVQAVEDEIVVQHRRCGGSRMPSPCGLLDRCGENTPVQVRLHNAVITSGVDDADLQPMIEAGVRILLDTGAIQRVHRHGYEWLVPSHLAAPDEREEYDGSSPLDWQHHATEALVFEWRKELGL